MAQILDLQEFDGPSYEDGMNVSSFSISNCKGFSSLSIAIC